MQDLFLMRVADGSVKQLTFDGRRIFGLAWNPADGNVVFSSLRAGGSRLWRISPSGGAPERIPGIPDAASFVALSAKGDRLAYTRSLIDTNIWRYPMPGVSNPGAQAMQIAPSTRQETAPEYSPDGSRIVFSSNRSGSMEIWITDAKGVNAGVLTAFNGAATGTPHWSPDGSQVVFDSRPGGNPDVYMVSAEGGAVRRLTEEPSEEIVPSWSRDGQWIYFASNRTGGAYQVWKMPAAGGEAIQVTHGGGFHAEESPDGKYLYFNKSPREPGLWRMPAGGGVEEEILPGLPGSHWGYWSASDRGVYYLDREEKLGQGAVYSLRFLDLAQRRVRILVPALKRPFNSGLSISPDGKWFLYTQVDQSDTDIMLVEGFR